MLIASSRFVGLFVVNFCLNCCEINVDNLIYNLILFKHWIL